MKPHRSPAVVLGLGVNGLGVVRSLGQEGVPVIGFYTHGREVGRVSRYCRPIRVPALDRNADQFLDALLQVAEPLDRPPLFPTNDQYLLFISEKRSALEGRYRLQVADAEVVRFLLNKSSTSRLAEQHGVPVPATRYPQSPDDLAAIEREIRFPCILKPLYTFSLQLPGAAKNIIVSDPARLQHFFRDRPDLLGRVVVQEVIHGGDGYIYVCAAYFDAKSEPRAVYTGRKLRQYPPDFGVTCFGESVYVPAIEQMTVAFLKAVRFRGLVAAEYTCDRHTGEYYLVEVNARSFYHNQLFTDSGINLAFTAYCDLLGVELVSGRPQQKEGMRWLDFQRDLSSFWRKRRRGELTWRHWLRSILTARSFAYFHPADLMPFAYATVLFLGVICLAVTRSLRRHRAY